jgi:hypothetical protein
LFIFTFGGALLTWSSRRLDLGEKRKTAVVFYAPCWCVSRGNLAKADTCQRNQKTKILGFLSRFLLLVAPRVGAGAWGGAPALVSCPAAAFYPRLDRPTDPEQAK